MTFAEPLYLYLGLVAVPLLGIFLAWSARRRRADLARLGEPNLIARLNVGVNHRGRRWQAGLWGAASLLVFLALARPQWGEEIRTVDQEGIQLMVALDVSESMLAEDVKPNRLSRAKMELADLMSQLGGDEIGLVLFSGASFIQFPLTSDYATARTFLDDARPSVISRPGTNIGDAVRTAMSGFDGKSSAQRVILLITDGEAHEGDALATVRQAAQEGVIFYTIGFGSSEGVPIPELDAAGNRIGFRQTGSGEVVLSRLDEATLQEIANIGSGRYFRAGSGTELSELIGELNRLQKAEIGARLDVTRIERFQPFLALALIAAALVYMIPERLAARDRVRRSRAIRSLVPTISVFR